LSSGAERNGERDIEKDGENRLLQVYILFLSGGKEASDSAIDLSSFEGSEAA